MVSRTKIIVAVTLGFVGVAVSGLLVYGIIVALRTNNKLGSPKNVKLSLGSGKRWYLNWDAPSQPGNTGAISYRLTITPQTGSSVTQSSITATSIPFPFSQQGSYQVSIMAYTSTIESQAAISTVTIYGPPVLSSFAFQSSMNPPDFTKPIVGSGTCSGPPPPITLVSDVQLVVSDPKGNVVVTANGTGSVNSGNNGFIVTIPSFPNTTFLSASIQGNMYYVGIVPTTTSLTDLMPLTMVEATQKSVLCGWDVMSDGTIASAFDSRFRWCIDGNGNLILTNNPHNWFQITINSAGQRGTVTYKRDKPMYLSITSSNVLNFVYDETDTAIFNIGLENSGDFLLGGSTLTLTCSISNDYGSLDNISSNTVTIPSIGPGPPQNIRAVYQ